MAHFYGTLQGSRGQATRCGTKTSGITTIAASWNGAIRVDVYRCEENNEDHYTVHAIPWHGQGASFQIACGVVGVRTCKSANCDEPASKNDQFCSECRQIVNDDHSRDTMTGRYAQ